MKLTKATLAENGFDVPRGVHAPSSRRAASAAAQTGYKGRTGLYEVMTMTDELRRLILDGARPRRPARPRRASRACARSARTASRRSRDGITSVPEVLRVVGSSTA